MNESEMLELMARFRRAYAIADREALVSVASEEFEWHQHRATDENELPQGQVLFGADSYNPGV